VLGGLLGAVAIALVVVALTMKPTGSARGWVGLALAVLLVGVVLYVLGRLVDRLLDGDPDPSS
jgi:MFS superfamily sulfate permease-like transporter